MLAISKSILKWWENGQYSKTWFFSHTRYPKYPMILKINWVRIGYWKLFRVRVGYRVPVGPWLECAILALLCVCDQKERRSKEAQRTSSKTSSTSMNATNTLWERSLYIHLKYIYIYKFIEIHLEILFGAQIQIPEMVGVQWIIAWKFLGLHTCVYTHNMRAGLSCPFNCNFHFGTETVISLLFWPLLLILCSIWRVKPEKTSLNLW